MFGYFRCDRFLLLGAWIMPLAICLSAVLLPHRSILAATEFEQRFQKQVAPMLSRYCVGCHGPKTAESDLRLDVLAPPNNFAARHQWDRVYSVLDGRDMPPEDQPQPTPEERRLILTTVAQGLRQSQRPILVRRLSMDEVANTLADLFSLDVQTVVPLLPDEGQQGTFDHVAQRSGLTADNHLSLMDGFDRLLARLMEVRDRPQPSTKAIDPFQGFNPKVGKGPFYKRKGPYYSRSRYIDEGICFSPALVAMKPHEPEGKAQDMGGIEVLTTRDRQPQSMPKVSGGLPLSGLLRLRIRAGAFPGTDGQPATLLVDVECGDVCRQRVRIDVSATPNAMREYEVIVPYCMPEDPVARRKFPLHVYVMNGHDASRMYRERTKEWNEWTPEDIQGLPELVIGKLEVEIPYTTIWPPPGQTLLLGKLDSRSDDATVHKSLELLLPQLWRRPLLANELSAVIAVFEDHRRSGAKPLEAYRAAVTAAVVSPSFLYLDGASPGSQYGLASRLSYALWRGPPDEELMQLAEKQKLNDPATISAQAQRLLRDPRAERFISRFVAQWLRLEPLDPAQLSDLELRFSRTLRESIEREPREMFAYLLRHDLSAGELFAEGMVVCNDRLADYYAIPGVHGSAFRPVSSPDDNPRGGLLAQSSVLNAMTGDASESSWPIYRGAWMTRKVLGMNLPNPPLGVPDINLSRSRSLREKLARHTDDARCASCHKKMDPLGFAFQSFEPTGRWRETQPDFDETGKNAQRVERMPRIPADTTGALPRGEAFGTFVEMRRSLNQHYRKDIHQNLARKLACWMLGRELTAVDRPLVERLRTDLQQQGLQTAIVSFLASDDFRRPLKEARVSP